MSSSLESFHVVIKLCAKTYINIYLLDGEAADLSEYNNINVVAGCLKLYLRLLPVPLLTHQLHQSLTDIICECLLNYMLLDSIDTSKLKYVLI